MATRSPAPTSARRGAADWLVLVGRFSGMAYLHFLLWLSIWVLIPMLLLGWRPMAVDSGSMGPVIQAGDVVMVAPSDGEKLAAGRIITFADPADPSRLVTHRITGVNDDGTYQTKGDANTDADSTPLPADHVEGVGRLVVPRVGLPVIWLRQGRPLFVVAWGLSVLLALALVGPAKPKQAQPQAPQAPRDTPAAPARRRLPVPKRAPRPARPASPVPVFTTAPVPALPAAPSMAPAPVATPPMLPHAPVPPAAAMLPHAPVPPAAATLPPAPVPPGVATPSTTLFMPAPGLVGVPTVPPVRYRMRLPRPPAAMPLPAPPTWKVSLVPPAPGAAPVAPIPVPPRAAAVRRGAMTGRQVPGWSTRLHAVVLVLGLVASLGAMGAAAAPPAAAAFRSAAISNSGNSFTADQLDDPGNPSISAPLAACQLNLGWTHSSSAWRDGYRIYRALNADSGYTLLAQVGVNQGTYSDTTATDPGTVYYYRIRAYEATNWESAPTGEVHASPLLAACL